MGGEEAYHLLQLETVIAMLGSDKSKARKLMGGIHDPQDHNCNIQVHLAILKNCVHKVPMLSFTVDWRHLNTYTNTHTASSQFRPRLLYPDIIQTSYTCSSDQWTRLQQSPQFRGLELIVRLAKNAVPCYCMLTTLHPKYLSPFTTTDISVNQFNNPAPIKRLFKEISTWLRQLLYSENTKNEQISCSKCRLLRTLTMLNTTRQKWKWKAKAWKNSKSQWMQYMPAWVMSCKCHQNATNTAGWKLPSLQTVSWLPTIDFRSLISLSWQ